jgi:hypothetical protein
MSSSAPAARRQRVELKATWRDDPAAPANSFCLVRGKAIPLVLECCVLSCIGARDCYQLVTLSKDVYELIKSFFHHLRDCEIDETNDSCWFLSAPLFRFCRQLRSIRVQSFGKSLSSRFVAGVVRNNAQPLERFESPGSIAKVVLEALAGCPSLTAVDGLGRIPEGEAVSTNLAKRLSSTCWGKVR